MSNHAENVCTKLAAASLGLTVGTNLFASKVREATSGAPSNCVFVTDMDAPAPMNYCDGAVTPQGKEPMLRITVRSAPQDYAGGRTLARSVRDALHDQTLSGYEAMRIEQVEPLPVGETPQGEHLFVLRCHLWIDE